jgi:hypothetical protein
MKQKFREIHLSKKNKIRLETINSIIEEYQAQGYRLTLRQLYYQLVSRDIIPNQQKEYSKLSILLKEGRMAGIVDWDAIEDRLRVPSSPSSFDGPEAILDACISQYMLPRMKDQAVYVEVWVEKDALSGVLKRVTEKYHIPILVNRGYSSASAMYDAYERFTEASENGQSIRILYLGDYDPSGIDMIRDIKTRTLEFIGADDVDFDIIPIALTKKQIQQYNPPPNPAKMSDPRAGDYVKENGKTSWEVDALKPEILNAVLTRNIEALIDTDLYEDIVSQEAEGTAKLRSLKQYL